MWAGEPLPDLGPAEGLVDVTATIAVHLAVRADCKVRVAVTDPDHRVELVHRLAEFLPPGRIGTVDSGGPRSVPGVGPRPDRPTGSVHVWSMTAGLKWATGGGTVEFGPGETGWVLSAARMLGDDVWRRVEVLDLAERRRWDPLGPPPFDVAVAGAAGGPPTVEP